MSANAAVSLSEEEVLMKDVAAMVLDQVHVVCMDMHVPASCMCVPWNRGVWKWRMKSYPRTWRLPRLLTSLARGSGGTKEICSLMNLMTVIYGFMVIQTLNDCKYGNEDVV